MTPRQEFEALIAKCQRDLESAKAKAIDAAIEQNEPAYQAHRLDIDTILSTLQDLLRGRAAWNDDDVAAFMADVKADRRTSLLLPN